MKNSLSALAVATLAALSTAPARADAIYSVNFRGTVYQSQGATGQSVGSTVAGHFDLDSATTSYLDFTIAGKSVAAVACPSQASDRP